MADRLELHDTPTHGAWCNMAAQCLDRRLPDCEPLAQEAAWETTRNAATTTINWRFTTADARIKLHHLYPSFDA